MKKICIITGSRAEYGLLRPLLRRLKDDSDFSLQLIATGMHLSNEFGLTYREIENDGFTINKKIDMLLASDTPASIVKSMGLGLIGFADAFTELKPDIILLLGDRYEILCAAEAAMMFTIPIVHLNGGEATYGLIDESIRHAISKMSHLHFTATEKYRNCVIQLGEHPDKVFNVGSIGLDTIASLIPFTKDELEKKYSVSLSKKTILVTYHPVTLETATTVRDFSLLLNELTQLDDTYIIFTKSNADQNGRMINSMIDSFVANHQDIACAFTSLGSQAYLSLLYYVHVVVGNSSSGIIEVPSFKIPTINIGSRQDGRIRAESVIDIPMESSAIRAAFQKAFDPDFRATLACINNPYGDGHTSERIVSILKKTDFEGILKKEFFTINHE